MFESVRIKRFYNILFLIDIVRIKNLCHFEIGQEKGFVGQKLSKSFRVSNAQRERKITSKS